MDINNHRYKMFCWLAANTKKLGADQEPKSLISAHELLAFVMDSDVPTRSEVADLLVAAGLMDEGTGKVYFEINYTGRDMPVNMFEEFMLFEKGNAEATHRLLQRKSKEQYTQFILGVVERRLPHATADFVQNAARTLTDNKEAISAFISNWCATPVTSPVVSSVRRAHTIHTSAKLTYLAYRRFCEVHNLTPVGKQLFIYGVITNDIEKSVGYVDGIPNSTYFLNLYVPGYANKTELELAARLDTCVIFAGDSYVLADGTFVIESEECLDNLSQVEIPKRTYTFRAKGRTHMPKLKRINLAEEGESTDSEDDEETSQGVGGCIVPDSEEKKQEIIKLMMQDKGVPYNTAKLAVETLIKIGGSYIY